MIVTDCSFILDLLLRPTTLNIPEVGISWHAPALLDVEIVSGIRGFLLGGHIDEPTARAALRDFGELGIRGWPVDAALRGRMLELAHRHTASDAAYVALAEALDAPLVTRDHRLAAGAPATVQVMLV